MKTLSLITLAISLCASLGAESILPLERAHSHNDYTRERPLLDALDQGFCSVEADIHLVDGALLVAHDHDQCKAENTLEKLYLDPLMERVKNNGGKVYPKGPCITLLIDFKSNARITWPVFKEKITPYHAMLTKFTDNSTEEKAVTIIISGSMPRKQVAAEKERYCAIDGRIPDLKKKSNPHLIPLVSASWTSVFSWIGMGKMPQDQQDHLATLVRQAHENGQRLRFWGLPTRSFMWPVLYEHGVDLINADDVARLGSFLREKAENK